MSKNPSRLCRMAIALLFATSGVSHFALTPAFMAIMPPYLPLHREAVYISGVFEIMGAAGLMFATTSRMAGVGLFALTVLVTPANVHMWLHPEQFPAFAPGLLFWRLPAQAALLLAIWFSAISRPDQSENAQRRNPARIPPP